MIASTALIVNLGLLAAVLGGGLLVERRVTVDARQRALPAWQRVLVGGVSFGPLAYVLFEGESGGVWLLDDTVLAIAWFVVAWIGLTLLFARTADGDTSAASGC